MEVHAAPRRPAATSGQGASGSPHRAAGASQQTVERRTLLTQGAAMPFPAARLAILEDMTIYQAQAQKEQLLAALAATAALELDLSAVPEMDTAGLQLLLLLKREALQQGKPLTIVGHSPERPASLDFCHLAGVFGDPMLISAQG
jgi:anti-sigma B factor antagonist